MCFLLLVSCSKSSKDIPYETSEPERDKFTLADGTAVPRYYYEYYLNLGNDEDTSLKLSYELTVKVKFAEEEGISINDQKKNSLITKMIYEFEDDFGTNYEDSVYKEYGVTSQNLIQIKLDELLVNLLLQEIGNEVVSIEDAEAYYNEHIDEYYSVTFLYAFVDEKNYSDEMTEIFNEVASREDMYSFIEKYSESDSKSEDVFLDVSNSKSLPDEVIGVIYDECLEVGSKYQVKTSNKTFFLMCEYIVDFSSSDVQNTIVDLLVSIKANEELDNRVNDFLNSIE